MSKYSDKLARQHNDYLKSLKKANNSLGKTPEMLQEIKRVRKLIKAIDKEERRRNAEEEEIRTKRKYLREQYLRSLKSGIPSLIDSTKQSRLYFEIERIKEKERREEQTR